MTAQILIPDLDLVNKAKYIMHIDDIVPGDPHRVLGAAKRARGLATKFNGARQVIDRVHGVNWYGGAARNFRTVQSQLSTSTKGMEKDQVQLVKVLQPFAELYVRAKSNARTLEHDIKQQRGRVVRVGEEITAAVAGLPASAIVGTIEKVLHIGHEESLTARIDRIKALIGEWRSGVAALDELVAQAEHLHKQFIETATAAANDIDKIAKGRDPGWVYKLWGDVKLLGGPESIGLDYLESHYPGLVGMGADVLNYESQMLGLAGSVCDMTGVGAVVGVPLQLLSLGAGVGASSLDSDLYFSGARDKNGNLIESSGSELATSWIMNGLNIFGFGKDDEGPKNFKDLFKEKGKEKGEEGVVSLLVEAAKDPQHADLHELTRAAIPDSLVHVPEFPPSHSDLRLHDLPPGYVPVEHEEGTLEKLEDVHNRVAGMFNQGQETGSNWLADKAADGLDAGRDGIFGAIDKAREGDRELEKKFPFLRDIPGERGVDNP